jgi:cell division protein FtsB
MRASAGRGSARAGGPGAARPSRPASGAASRVGSRAAPRAGAGDQARAGDQTRAPGSRPAAARRAAPGGSAKRTRAPQPRRATGRSVVLGLVLLGLLLAYTYPVRVYLAQQAEISALEGQQAAQREKIGELRERSQKWDDPQFVISQARKRLNMGLPGEQNYVVVDPNAGPAADSAARDPAAAQQARPWYGKLWWSIEAANKR